MNSMSVIIIIVTILMVTVMGTLFGLTLVRMQHIGDFTFTGVLQNVSVTSGGFMSQAKVTLTFSDGTLLVLGGSVGQLLQVGAEYTVKYYGTSTGLKLESITRTEG